MGNTTLIELDHDRYSEIERQPELFTKQILYYLRAGIDARQEIEGGQIIAFFPRWRSKKHLAWCAWKEKWSKPL